jgi:hypothetical protein
MYCNPRYWSIWDDDFLSDDDNETKVMRALVGVLAGLLLGSAAGIVADLFLPIGPVLFFVIWPSVVVLSVFTHKFGILSRVSTNSNYNYSYLRQEARYYLKMSRSERREYPSNTLDLLRDPHITDEQKEQIAGEMRELRIAITQRALERAALRAKHVDIDGALAVLRDNTSGIKEETKAYQEFK